MHKFGFVKSSAKNAPECISKLLQKRGETQPIGSLIVARYLKILSVVMLLHILKIVA